MSNTLASATGVSYEVKFTAGSAGIQSFILDFCSNSPVLADTCTAPAGFDLTGATTTTSGATLSIVAGNGTGGKKTEVEVDKTYSGGASVDVILNGTGVTNPSAVGAFYARIITYAATGEATDATNPYDSQHPDKDNANSAMIDSGGLALSTTNTIGVTSFVRESMTFCVASAAITQDCGNASSNLPNVTIGQAVGSGTALSTSTISTGTIYTQLSTNAAHGAVINLKTDATGCGGLVLFGGSGCIPPAVYSNAQLGDEALFGVETSAATPTASDNDATGTLEPVSGQNYSSSKYNLNYASNNNSGVTSTYGDPFLDSGAAPVDNENMALTFGAQASNNTPAGKYTANLGMIATGTY